MKCFFTILISLLIGKAFAQESSIKYIDAKIDVDGEFNVL